MKHLSLSFLLIILICSCGNATKNDSNVGSAQEANAENTESSANASGKKAQKGDEDIIARVKAIYEDVFNEYNEALESESIPQSSPDEKYCSADWNKVLDKVTEFDAVNNPDGIGFFDADYWVMGQDFNEVSISDVQVTERSKDNNKAKVEFKLHNAGSTSVVRLDMVYEKDNWFIDNFTDVDNDLDWKADMLEYLKENNVK